MKIVLLSSEEWQKSLIVVIIVGLDYLVIASESDNRLANINSYNDLIILFITCLA